MCIQILWKAHWYCQFGLVYGEQLTKIEADIAILNQIKTSKNYCITKIQDTNYFLDQFKDLN
jgi:hypothetical protein